MGECEIWFYHLERARLEQVLPELLEKTLARGWRALVRTPSPERIEQLDSWLWTYRDDSFLAHGLASEPMADRTPVVLTQSAENPNGARALFLLDGAEAGDLADFERCILIFDGGDEAAVAEARGKWAAFRQAGHEVAYWRQGAEKGWERQA
ncbi:MAG TPA: DNA polymerase III subunit chi [Caulobacteraceae bacterium]|jgi:DNA polymerase-3 subunit chi|nr:DNA polymerase III subunit chi [Caulobacteraceae bacterium]